MYWSVDCVELVMVDRFLPKLIWLKANSSSFNNVGSLLQMLMNAQIIMEDVSRAV